MGHKYGVAVLLQRGEQILMGLRQGSRGAGTWALPGGHIEPDEAPDQTCVREVLEETGLRIHILRPLAFTYNVIEGQAYVTLFFQAECRENQCYDEPKLIEPEKCAEWRWVTPGDWPGPLFSPFQSLVAQHFLPGTCGSRLGRTYCSLAKDHQGRHSSYEGSLVWDDNIRFCLYED